MQDEVFSLTRQPTKKPFGADTTFDLVADREREIIGSCTQLAITASGPLLLHRSCHTLRNGDFDLAVE